MNCIRKKRNKILIYISFTFLFFLFSCVSKKDYQIFKDIKNKDYDSFKKSLEKGQDIHSKHKIELGANYHYHYTCYFSIAEFTLAYGNLKMIDLILSRNISLVNKNQSCIYGIYYNDPTILLFLRNYNITEDEKILLLEKYKFFFESILDEKILILALWKVTLHEKLKLFNYLMDKVKNIDCVDEEGLTLLMRLSPRGQRGYSLTYIKRVVEKGSDLNFKDPDGFTAIREASYFGYLEIVKYLHSKGADINIRDKQGISILGWAKKGLKLSQEKEKKDAYSFEVEKDYIKIIQYLKSKGAKE
jgi:hypothetical protein